MSLANRILRFYVYSNLHVAVAVACLVKITLIESLIDSNTTAFLMGCGTVIAYNFIRWMQIDRIRNHLSIWMRSNIRSLIVLNGLCLLAAAFLLIQLPLESIYVLLPFSLITVLYALPLNNRGGRGLRFVPGLKLLLIAITWAGLTVIFPMKAEGIIFTKETWGIVVQRILFIMAITIPFDIRDYHYDDGSLKTLPQLVGVGWSKAIGIFCLLLFVWLEWIVFGDGSMGKISLLAGLASLLIVGSSVGQSRFYSAFWVESLPLLWLAFVMTDQL